MGSVFPADREIAHASLWTPKHHILARAEWFVHDIRGVWIMKTIVSALIALSVITGVAAPASAAWDTKAFWEDLARSAQ